MKKIILYALLSSLFALPLYAQKTLFTGSAGTRATKAFYILNAAGDTLFFSTGDSTRIKKDLYIIDAVGDTVAKFQDGLIELLESIEITGSGFKNFILNTGATTTAAGTLRRNSAALEYREDGQWVRLTEDKFGFHPLAGFTPADSGAVLDTLQNWEDVLSFSNTADQYAYYTYFPPGNYGGELDTIKIMFSTASAAGDSVGWVLGFDSISSGTAVDDAFSPTLNIPNQYDIPAANITYIAKFTTAGLISFIDGLDIKGFIRLKRDVSISNNVAAAVRVHGVFVHFKP